MNSMILHELFFDGLGDQSEPDASLTEALARDFGSYDRWRSEFVAMGKALGGGSGWVFLSWSPRNNRLVNQWAADHCHTLAGGTPISGSTCMSIPITSIGAKAATMSIHSWRQLIGPLFGAIMTGSGYESSNVTCPRIGRRIALAGLWMGRSCTRRFRLLDEKGIRARVIGRDITDSSHWSIYLRSDGALLRDEMGRKWTGIWKIQNNRLCMSNPSVNRRL